MKNCACSAAWMWRSTRANGSRFSAPAARAKARCCICSADSTAPTRGTVTYETTNVFSLHGWRLDSYRNRHVGFVFQFYHLLPELTALENVLIASMIRHSIFQWPGARSAQRQRAAELLDRMGLGARLKHKPSKLSGGERQRVAIARALMNGPAVLLADEPTGNLDAKTGGQILELFQGLHQQGQTIIMVTHDANVAAAADRRLTLVAGKLKPQMNTGGQG